MPRRIYSDKYMAAVWAMRCQQGEKRSPTKIKRALANDELGLGYSIDPPIRTLIDHLDKLERIHGPAHAQVAPGEEAEAIDSIRREGIGAIRATVRDLSARRNAGHELTPNQLRALDVAVKSADSFNERERRAAQRGTAQERAGTASAKGRKTEPSTLLRHFAKQIGSTETDQAAGLDHQYEPDQEEEVSSEPTDTVPRKRERSLPALAGPA